MQRPTRIAAVIATTALLMTTTAVGALSIQQAAAGAGSGPAISADGPALADGTALVDPALAPIGATKLPSIKKILQTAGQASAPAAPAPVAAAATGSVSTEHEAQEREDGDEHEGSDD